tara:strand:+ start:223 stop:795 length:573 start_codon:yes stop_codon:yes gene_type:complete
MSNELDNIYESIKYLEYLEQNPEIELDTLMDICYPYSKDYVNYSKYNRIFTLIISILYVLFILKILNSSKGDIYIKMCKILFLFPILIFIFIGYYIKKFVYPFLNDDILKDKKISIGNIKSYIIYLFKDENYRVFNYKYYLNEPFYNKPFKIETKKETDKKDITLLKKFEEFLLNIFIKEWPDLFENNKD